MKTTRLVKKIKEVSDRLRKVLYSTLRKFRSLLLKSKPYRVSMRYGRMEAIRALRLFFKLLHFQLSIRPRIRLVSTVILVLIFSMIAAGKASYFIQARQGEIKVNGQAILVAKNTQADNRPTPEIEGSIGAVRSPFDYRKPVEGYISQHYSAYHRAIDIATGAVGVPIKSLGSGRVEFAGFLRDGKGNVVIVDHGNNLKSLYAHMGKINVGTGNEVDSNTNIGTVGLTGHTTGAHLHLEVYDNEISVDPAKLLP